MSWGANSLEGKCRGEQIAGGQTAGEQIAGEQIAGYENTYPKCEYIRELY